MLPKKNRLTCRESERVIKEGSTFSSPLFTLKCEGGNEHTKCSIAVSKKVAKKAVERNRMRRRVYAECREILDVFPRGTHALFFARRAVRDASQAEIRQHLVQLAQRAGQKS